MSSPWVVHKFGGTSLADAERFRRVVAILRAEEGERKAVVVSAMGKVTDALVDLIDRARARDESYLERLDDLKARHLQTMEALLATDSEQSIRGGARVRFQGYPGASPRRLPESHLLGSNTRACHWERRALVRAALECLPQLGGD